MTTYDKASKKEKKARDNAARSRFATGQRPHELVHKDKRKPNRQQRKRQDQKEIAGE